MTDKISAKQVQALTLILYGWKAVEIAEDLDVSPQTLSRWKQEPAFKALLNLNKLEILNSARERLQVCAEKAVDELVELATEAESPELRRKACLDIIQLVGLSDPAKGLFGWGIGATTAQGVIEEAISDRYARELATPDYILRYRKSQVEED